MADDISLGPAAANTAEKKRNEGVNNLSTKWPFCKSWAIFFK